MKKILIIEDNQDVRENTAALLELSNYTVKTAENGVDGIKKAKQFEPDVIICDIMMPELDGYGVLKALSKYKKTASTPFIFLTAKTEKSDVRKGMNLGADDYLTKPFTEQDLLDAIECRLKKHDFLIKEFSKNIEGVTEFINEASEYLNIDTISKEYSLKKFKKKDMIFMEGLTANSLRFINSGAVKTYKTTETGKEFVTGIYGSGNFIGQMSMLSDKGLYIESASAIEDSEIYEIPKTDFLTLLHGNMDVANKFIHLISNNLAETKDQLVNMAFASVRQKVAKALLDLKQKGVLKDKHNSSISIPREDFAGIVGTATETAIRMLTEFKNAGFISIGAGRKITITNEKALKDIIAFN